MLRSTLVRNKITTNYLKKYIRTTVRNCLGSQLMQRKPSQVANAQNRRIYKPQWNVQRSYGDLPSHTKVNLPALSPTMETGTVVKWLKKEGDELSEGDPLCEIETDKAVMGFESPDGGFLAKIMIPQGTKGVPIGKLLCIIVQDKAHIAAFKDFKDEGGPALAAAKAPAAAAPAPAPAAAPAPAPAAAPAPVAARPPAPAPAPAPAPVAAPAAAPSGGRVLASPMARKLAAAKQIRLGGKGSGLYGSLKSTDLSGAGAAAPAAAAPAATAPAAARAPAVARTPAAASGAPYVDIPVTSMRATIAKRLMESKLTIPHYQLAVTVNVEKIMKMRQIINKQLAEEKKKEKLSMNDFIIKAVAGACVRVPAANSHWLETSIRQFNHVDVCVAVATPTGLLTPIIFNCDTRGLIDISNNMKDLAKKAREGKLKPHEFQGGTVTISNLGMFGIQMFNAIVNPPQTLILACGGTQDIVIPDKKKGFRVGKFVTFTSSANHKAIDGAECAMWMKAFKQNLEDPAYMIL